MGWRDIGDDLFAEVREQWLNWAAASLNRANTDLNVPGLKLSRRPAEAIEASPGFIKAVFTWEKGNPDDLIEYLSQICQSTSETDSASLSLPSAG